MEITKITLVMIDTKTKQKAKVITMISEESIVTRYSDQKQAHSSYQALKAQNSDIEGYDVEYKRGVIFELFPNKTREELRIFTLLQEEKIREVAENESMGRVKYKRTEEEIIRKEW